MTTKTEAALTPEQEAAWATDCAERAAALAGDHRDMLEHTIRVSRWCLAGAPMQKARKHLAYCCRKIADWALDVIGRTRESESEFAAYAAARTQIASAVAAYSVAECANPQAVADAAGAARADSADTATATDADWDKAFEEERAWQAGRLVEYATGVAQLPTELPTQDDLWLFIADAKEGDAVAAEARECLKWLEARGQ